MDKRRMKPVQQFLAILLCLAMVLPMALPARAEESKGGSVGTNAPGAAPGTAPGASTEDTGSGLDELTLDGSTKEATTGPLAVVYAASDFQLKKYNSSGTATGDDVAGAKAQMKAIVDYIKETAGYTAVNGALFCGDLSAYYNTWSSSKTDVTKNNAGSDAVATVLKDAWSLADEDVIYVQGNHDPADTKRLDNSGGQEFEHYNVFVMHEDDFQWDQGLASDKSGNTTNAQEAALAIAGELKTYLEGKVKDKDNRPIFVCAHVPLHFGYRTVKNSDNIYAKYVFDVLNEYGKKLNIIFLFGHDHSSTYDDYIGGAAVYLPAGDKLRVPNEGSNSASTEYTLNFTYMNAGYLGYYEGKCETNLSSSVFMIYEDKVVVARYDHDSAANLKDKGIKASTDTWDGAKANTTVYTNDSEKATITLKTFEVDLDYGTLASGMMLVGNTGDLTVKGLYNTTYTVEWTSSDESIATVTPSADGMTATVTAMAPGEVTITAVATEISKTKAVGDVATLEYTLEVVDTVSSAGVVLLEAGDYTYFKKVDSVEIGKVYAFIDLEDDGYLIGQQEALHFNNNIDAKKEGDIDVAADTDKNFQELNASGEEVFQLPVGSELLTLADITNENCWWVADVAKEAGNVGGTIRTYKSRTYNYLFAIEGDADFLDRDADQDRIATGNEAEAKTTGGAHWYYDTTHGLVTNHKTDGFQYALYYSQANTDFSAYRINHNGAHGDSKFNEDGTLANEDVHSRVYPFEQVTITLAQPITASLSDTTGYVNKDVGYTDDDGKRRGGAQTGDTIIVNNGTMTVEIPVTIDMLSGTFDVTKPGTYSGLTVTYAGVAVVTEGYTLKVNDSATILKNDAAREYMDTIYTRVDKWYPGRQYLIVDTDEEGIGHAMGVIDGTVTAHNVLVQNLPVDGKDKLYIDASRYSDKADATVSSLVGRGIKDQGNINEYLNASITKANYYKSIGLVWTVTQRFFPTDGSPEISDARDKDYYFLQSQSQVSQNAADRTLYIGANARDTQLKLGSQAETSGKETGDSAGASLDWWWELWQYGKSNGVHLAASQARFAYLFYNWQNIIGSTADGAATKNFQTGMATDDGDDTVEDADFPMTAHRRVWIYERVTNIDTISARISDKSATMTVRIPDVSESTHGAAFTGDYILVDTTHADGTVTTQQVPITVSMLSGTYDLETVGSYPNLTVTYQGVAVCTDYVLNIVDFVANDYPEFPDEGAVRVDKQLDTTKYDYLETGVASIDLSVSGIPAQSGVNLIVIIDASSSMQNCPHGSYKVGSTKCTTCGTVTYNKTRMGLMEATLESMLTQLKAPMDNGYSPDVDVAVATFNGYTLINSSYEFWHSGLYSDDDGKTTLTHAAAQQIQEHRVDASEILLPFTPIADVDPSFANVNTTDRDIAYSPGTNYDRAMELAYQLLKAKQEQDAVDGVTRDAFVVFMSDGAPYQFNYFHGDPNIKHWPSYLQGKLTTSSAAVTNQAAAVRSAFAKYYNAEGKHWLAEAIKGDPNETYKIIDRHAMTTDHVTEINGMGATLYSIGFGLAGDHLVTKAVCEQVLKDMATDTDHYLPADDGDALEAAFSKIAGEVRSAGNAVFHDQMGTQFDLVTSNILYITNDLGEAETVDLTDNKPTITVKTYQLYKRSEIGKTIDGVLVTETMVGSRKPVDPTILEKVTFNDDGSVVSSDKKSGNILNGKVIEAATFFYNTDKANAQNITVNGKTVSLAPETFYWNIGDIPQDELVLSYSVYLSGSMEGLRPAGTYDTNNYAKLTYTNYLDHECEQSVPTPKLPWDQGTVGYAFYLVNKDGQPIINQSSGQIGSFEQSVRITQPVYLDFYLNSEGEEVMAEIIKAGDVMPEGYTLFDPTAQYEVLLDSNGTGYYKVTVGRSDGIKTTYVEGVAPTAIQPAGQTNTTDYVTANTVVWFAVVAETKAVPDTVVIDFGLPVEIDVLANDVMMGDYGSLQYITSEAEYLNAHSVLDGQKLWEYLQVVGIEKAPHFTSNNPEGKYGKLELVKVDGKTNGKVRYTLNDSNGMQMESEDTFVYAVNYTGGVGAQGYYYSTVTVIPATTIYYEDSFVTFAVKDYDSENGDPIDDPAVQWITDGTTQDAVQAEDRPGQFSLSQLDANNIYGYDKAYAEMTEYSLGSAKKITVGARMLSDGTTVKNVYGTAQFTFKGTGFDVVSVTSDKTGTIVVKVKGTSDAGESVSKNFIVDTYYGYMYTLCNVVYKWNTFGTEDTGDDKWVMIPVSVNTDEGAEADESEPSTENRKDGDEEEGIAMAWIVDKSESPYGTGKNALYQIPVMKVADLPYGKYTVTISASYREMFDHEQYEPDADCYDFYLDAIRIYNPANDGEGNKTIEDAYKADGEGWPSYKELRNMLITAGDFYAATESGEKDGAIFIDNTKASGGDKYTIEDYKNYGPNNEVYLAPGQAVAFKLEAKSDKVAAIHLAMKSVNGNTSAKVYDAASNQEVAPMQINTATDLYYDITGLNGCTVVIQNSGDSILSITNIKTTYTEAYESGDEFETNMVVSREVAYLALASLNSAEETPSEPEVPETSEPEVPETSEPEVPETTEPEVTEPEETEPDVFEPDMVDIKVNNKKVKVGSLVLVTVTTSDDVDSITINGVEVKDCTSNRRKGIRTWRVRVKATEVGEMDLSVVCYNSEDQASEPVVETITVTSKHNKIRDRLEDILLNLLNGLRKNG